MPATQINITLGTAGHIDHGKTALIRNLTGCETDRLKEEKERGMSIELGFAPCVLADLEVGIVDVPGHEHFVKTMVAGASGMDGVIFVVAADDGVMPQTREHLDILTLLGIRHGVVAMTKADRLDPDLVNVAAEDVHAFLQGTFLENAPIVPVSNMTGDGFGALGNALAAMVRGMKPRSSDGVFRIPLERAFAVKGYGTVVSGIPVAGSAKVGDELVLLPRGVPGQVRAIQVYGRDSDTVRAGQCSAINVRQWDHDIVERGNIAAAPGYFSASEWCVCHLRMLMHERAVLKSGHEVRLHTGTSDTPATLYLLGGQQILPGDEQVVQIRAAHPIVVGPGDKFILRTLSPVRTVGGGTIVEATTSRLKRHRPEILEDLQARAQAVVSEIEFVEYCIRTAASLASAADAIGRRAKVPPHCLGGMLDELLKRQKIIGLPGDLLMHADTANTAAERLLAEVRAFHAQSPESPGLVPEELRNSLGIERNVFDAFVRHLVEHKRLAERSHRLALPEHQESFSDEDRQLLDRVEMLFRQAAFAPPGADEVAARAALPRPKVDRLIALLLQHERLVRVADDLLFHRNAVEQARERIVTHIREKGRLESVDFKYLLETTRKFAIPLLDYFDRIGVTLRRGYTRYLGDAKPPADASK